MFIDRAQVPDVSMRNLLCTDADDMLCCSATVGNLEERGEPDILTSKGKALVSFAFPTDRTKHTRGLHLRYRLVPFTCATFRIKHTLYFKHESELLYIYMKYQHVKMKLFQLQALRFHHNWTRQKRKKFLLLIVLIILLVKTRQKCQQSHFQIYSDTIRPDEQGKSDKNYCR